MVNDIDYDSIYLMPVFENIHYRLPKSRANDCKDEIFPFIKQALNIYKEIGHERWIYQFQRFENKPHPYTMKKIIYMFFSYFDSDKFSDEWWKYMISKFCNQDLFFTNNNKQHQVAFDEGRFLDITNLTDQLFLRLEPILVLVELER